MINQTPLTVLYQDEHILAVHKAAGIVSVPAPNIPEWKTLQGQVRGWALENNLGFKPYLLHRLDRDTSGVMLFGKFSRDRAALEAIFKDSRTQKTYLALVRWIPKQPEGTIRIPLSARTAEKKVPALTHYKIMQKLEGCSILEVMIETGRRHQIRQHLAMIGNPLVLDPEYGDRSFDRLYQKKNKGRGRFFLHAWKFHFYHPFLEKELTITDEPDSLPTIRPKKR